MTDTQGSDHVVLKGTRPGPGEANSSISGGDCTPFGHRPELSVGDRLGKTFSRSDALIAGRLARQPGAGVEVERPQRSEDDRPRRR